VEAFEEVRSHEKTLAEAITSYEAELIPRGSEEVKCSVENGKMLHDWEQVKNSPVFQQGFKPMTGHDTKEVVSEHAELHKALHQEELKAAQVAH
jgi:hypothetical protein